MEKLNKKSSVRDIIINRPEYLTTRRRAGEKTATVAFWWLWSLWFRPAMMLLLWALGGRLVVVEIFNGPDMKTLWNYIIWISAAYIALQTWNRYNYMHFRQKTRRKWSKDVADSEIGDFLGISETDARRMKTWQSINVHFSGDDGMVFEPGNDNRSEPVRTNSVPGAARPLENCKGGEGSCSTPVPGIPPRWMRNNKN